MKKTTETIISVGGGILIGLVNGFFGSGGGMLCVPLLEKGLKQDTKTAHATAILVILPISIASLIVYMINGYVDFNFMLYTSLGVVSGGIVGALLLKWMPAKITAIIFALLMIFIGIKLALF